MWVFFNQILMKYKQGENLDEKDFGYLSELIKFHESAVEKIGVGVESIRVGLALGFDDPSICFILKRKDGTEENFSYNKCILNIFESRKNNQNKQKNEKKPDKKRQRAEFKPGCVLLVEKLVNNQSGDASTKAADSSATTTSTSTTPDQATSSTTTEQTGIVTDGQNDKANSSTTSQDTATETKNEQQTKQDSTDKMETTATTSTDTVKPEGNGKVTRKQHSGPSPKDMKQYYAKYGLVKWVSFDNNLFFIQFADPESAIKALNDDGTIIGPSVKQSVVTGEEEKNFYTKAKLQQQRGSQSFKRGGGHPHKRFRK